MFVCECLGLKLSVDLFQYWQDYIKIISADGAQREEYTHGHMYLWKYILPTMYVCLCALTKHFWVSNT